VYHLKYPVAYTFVDIFAVWLFKVTLGFVRVG